MLKRIVALYSCPGSLAHMQPIHLAVLRKDKAALREILEKEAEMVNARDSWNWTPLHLAMAWDNIDATRALLAAGADVNCVGGTFLETPIELGITYRSPRCVRELVTAGARLAPSCRIENGMLDQLFCGLKAMNQQCVEISRLLLLRKPSIARDRDAWGRTALHHLAYIGEGTCEMEICRLLLDAGADLRARDYKGKTPLALALENGHLAFASWLLEAGVSLEELWNDEEGGKFLHHVAASWSVKAIEYVCSTARQCPDVDVEQRSYRGYDAWSLFIRKLGSRSLVQPKHRRDWNAADVAAFVGLFTSCRNRALENEITALAETLPGLTAKDNEGSIKRLEPLIRLKDDRGRYEEAQTLRTIGLQVREGMWEAAAESVEEKISVLRSEMDNSPWKRSTHYDIWLYRKYRREELLALRGGIELPTDDKWYSVIEEEARNRMVLPTPPSPPTV